MGLPETTMVRLCLLGLAALTGLLSLSKVLATGMLLTYMLV